MSDYLSNVAKSGQVNTPPGSYVTVKEWAQNSFLNQQSNLLEVGCSNGFITIEMARYTGAKCTGIDLHEASVVKAQTNVDQYVDHLVSFRQGDAGNLPFNDEVFSHVVVSGHLPFIPAELRRSHIEEALRVVKPWGYLLIGLYYYHTTPPIELVAEFNKTIGTNVSADGDKTYWSGLFNDLLITLEYESDYDVIPFDGTRSAEYVAQMEKGTQNDWIRYLRLFNENGRYLSYFVRVYRKIPNESVLMLQIPRGGIYGIAPKQSRNV